MVTPSSNLGEYPRTGAWQTMFMGTDVPEGVRKAQLKVQLAQSNSVTPWIVTCHAPPSMGFSKQEHEWISLSISSKVLRETPKQTVFWAKLLKSGLQFTIGLCGSKPWLFPTYDPLDFSISLFLL